VNLPNTLTVSRIFLTVIFIIIFTQKGLEPKVFALIIFTLASLTDYLDGYIARKHNLISRFGKIMDPIADKFLLLSAFFIFMQMHLIAVWMFILIFAREVSVTGLRLFAIRKGLTLAAEGAGKVKTVLQIVSVYLIIIFSILAQLSIHTQQYQILMRRFINGIDALMLIVVAVTLWSGITFLGNNKGKIFCVR